MAGQPSLALVEVALDVGSGVLMGKAIDSSSVAIRSVGRGKGDRTCSATAEGISPDLRRRAAQDQGVPPRRHRPLPGPLAGLGEGLWFTGSSSFSSPAGDFSTLTKNLMDGTYTRTLPDGTVFRFDASGRETSVADRNNLRVTYSYDGSGKLTSILDPYGKTTSLAYDPVTNLLLSVSDPANRVTTFVHLGTNLSSVVLPDTAVWLYGYDTSKRLTSLTDPRLKMLTVTYDGAGRVSGTSRPDGSSEAFTAYQERGWVAAGSGTSGSPAAATLLAEDSRDLNAHLWAVAPANPSRRPHQHRVSQYSLFLTASNTARRMVQMGAMDHGAGEKEYTQGRRNGRLTLFRLAGVTISTLVVVTNPCSGLDSDGSGAEN